MAFFLGMLLVVAATLASLATDRELIAQLRKRMRRQEASHLPMLKGDAISQDALELALNELTKYAKELRPDYILGIHAPGRLLSVYLASKIGLPLSKCKYVSTKMGANLGITVEDLEEIAGTILIVDDISRSGSTISQIKQHVEMNFIDKNYNANVKSAVLICCAIGKKLIKDLSFIDWAYYQSENFYISMPWTRMSTGIKISDERRKKKILPLNPNDKKYLDLLEDMVNNAQFALKVSNVYTSGNVYSLNDYNKDSSRHATIASEARIVSNS